MHHFTAQTFCPVSVFIRCILTVLGSNFPHEAAVTESRAAFPGESRKVFALRLQPARTNLWSFHGWSCLIRFCQRGSAAQVLVRDRYWFVFQVLVLKEKPKTKSTDKNQLLVRELHGVIQTKKLYPVTPLPSIAPSGTEGFSFVQQQEARLVLVQMHFVTKWLSVVFVSPNASLYLVFS